MSEKVLFDFLKMHNITYQLFEHQPVFTVDDKPVVTAIDGVATTEDSVPMPHFKTLFLKDKKGAYFLVSVIEDKRVDLNALNVALGAARFSFGKPEDLLELLKLTPGSVTPFGLMFDVQKKITFVLDEDALAYASVSFHPLRNDMTIVIATQSFLACMDKMKHQPQVIRIPVK